MLKFWAKIRRGFGGSCKLNTRWYNKIGVFRPVPRFISKVVQNSAIFTLEDVIVAVTYKTVVTYSVLVPEII